MNAGLGALDDLVRGQPDAVVDHVHAGVGGAHGDLLGAVGMAVEPRLADQKLEPPAELQRDALDLAAQRIEIVRRLARPGATPVGARNSPNSARSAAPHSPVVTPAFAASIEGGMMFAPLLRRRAVLSAAATRASSRCARHALSRATCSASASGEGTMIEVSPAVSGDGSVLVKPLTPTTICSPRSIASIRRVLDSTSLPSDRLSRSPSPRRPSRRWPRSRRAPRASSYPTARDLMAAVENVAEFEKVCLVGHDLLQAQRPLLIERPRQAERLVPGRQLHGAGARVFDSTTDNISIRMR